MQVHRAEELDFSVDSKILLFNDGPTTEKYAGTRVILGYQENIGEFVGITRESRNSTHKILRLKTRLKTLQCF